MNFHFHVPAGLAHAAHKLHTYVQRMEVSAHCAYLGMVTVGHTDYYLAAGAMLATTLVGMVLHLIIALESAS